MRGLAWIMIGVGVGLLLAPRTGEETRQQLVERMQNLGNKAKSGELADNFGSAVSTMTEQVQKGVAQAQA